jgi:cell division inhibitor SulA
VVKPLDKPLEMLVKETAQQHAKPTHAVVPRFPLPQQDAPSSSWLLWEIPLVSEKQTGWMGPSLSDKKVVELSRLDP